MLRISRTRRRLAGALTALAVTAAAAVSGQVLFNAPPATALAADTYTWKSVAIGGPRSGSAWS